MVKANKVEAATTKVSKDVSAESATPTKQPTASALNVETNVGLDQSDIVDADAEPKSIPRIRLRVGESKEKAKQFATAQGLSMHLKVIKAKRAGLSALHKVTTWFATKKQ